MTPYTLHGSGRRTTGDWAALAANMSNATAAWADLSGFHIAPALPPLPPVSTHLWAWTVGHWLRVRIDYDYWWAALLRQNTTPSPTASPWSTHDDILDLHHEHLQHWPPTAGEVAQRRLIPTNALTGYQMVQLTPVRPTTATFIGTLDTISPSQQ